MEKMKKKPVWRGVSHQWGAVLAALLGGWLVWEATEPAARDAAWIYGLSLTSLLAVSAIYHRVTWSPVKRAWMRRLDHTMIFVLIAGSYTPVCTLVLDGKLATFTLSAVWGSVVVGALYNLFWVHGPKWVMALLCSIVGWIAVVTLSELHRKLGTPFMVLLSLGGACYSVGALVYAFRRPDPAPEVFGYHEIFHLLVLAAAFSHYAAFKIYIFDPLT